MDIATIKRLDVKFQPHQEYRYWLYDPEGDGMTYYRTAEARDESAKAAVSQYLDDGVWADEVSGVAAGEITHLASEVDVLMRPDDLDEEDCDGQGIYWGPDMDKRCNYALVPVTPNAELCGVRSTSERAPGYAAGGNGERE